MRTYHQYTRAHRRVVFFAALLFFALFTVFGIFAGGESEQSVDRPSEQGQAQAQEQQATAYPMTVRDDLGNEIVIESEPQRIASLTLFTDEVLFDLVGSQRLAAITYLATDKVYSNVADRADEVAVELDLNVEALIELDPDIIFVADWSDSAKVAQLRRAGLKVYAIGTPVTMAGIQSEILNLGRLLNAADSAQAIVDEMNRILQSVADALANLPPAERLSGMDYTSWENSSASGTTWNSVLEAAAVENAVAAFETDEYGQAPMSRELLIELNPDILFLPGWIWGDPEGAKNFEQSVKNDPSLQGITAIREDRIYLVPENLKSTYSQYIADAVHTVARLVYPEYVGVGVDVDVDVE